MHKTRPGMTGSVGSLGTIDSACSAARGICDVTVRAFLLLPPPSDEKQESMAAACRARAGSRGRKRLAEQNDSAHRRMMGFGCGGGVLWCLLKQSI